MDDWYYQNILFEIINNNNLSVKELEPVKEQLFRIVNHYNDLGCIKYGNTIHSCSIEEVTFIKKLIDTLKLVIKDNKYHELDETINMLINKQVVFSSFPECLKANIYDKEYIEFYKESLKGDLLLKKYEPVKEYIFKIINHYSIRAPFKYEEHDKYYGINEIKFIKDLLKTFDLIMSNNAYDNLDESINYLFDLDVIFAYFTRFLKAIIFKNEYQDNDMDIQDYYHTMRLLCSNDLNNKIDSNLRIANIIKRYHTYYVDCSIKTLSQYEREKYNFYRVIAPFIIGEFYLTDLSIEHLDKVLANVLNKYDEDISYLSLNGLDNRLDREELTKIAKVLLQGCNEKKKSIR